MGAIRIPRTEPASGVVNWPRVLEIVQRSRALDALEETRLVPERKVLYQFTARGHDVTQALLAQHLDGPRDGVAVYYRSRPLMLGLGLELDEALASTMMRVGGMSEGRDIGVVFNLPRRDGPCVLPACGGVGTQFSPAVGWAQSLSYRARVLDERAVVGSIAVAHGGEASTATSGFWAALNIATTQRLPVLFFIEDNAYGISVRSEFQTPGANIAANLASFANLRVLDGDGSDPADAPALIAQAVAHVRSGAGPALLRLTVPRLSGHSGQDTQAYKTPPEVAAEVARDPLTTLRRFLVPGRLAESEWQSIEERARRDVESARAAVDARPFTDAGRVRRYVFSELDETGAVEVQLQGGLLAEGLSCPGSSTEPRPDGPRINMLTAIRRTLDHELAVNPRVLVFGEDVGRKGGVHAATLGLQEKYGVERVFDTSLSEEGIIGRAVGMALAGPDARARDPVPQVRRARSRAVERLRLHALAHREPVCRTHGRSYARWILQVRRSLAQSVQRGAVRARGRLAPCDAVECRGCGGAAAVRPAGQRSDDFLRAPRDARRRLGAPPVPGR